MPQRNHQITQVYIGIYFLFLLEDTQESLFMYWPSMSAALAKLNSYVFHFQTHIQPKQVSLKDNYKYASVSWEWARWDKIQNQKLIVRNFRILSHSLLQLKCLCLNTNHPDLQEGEGSQKVNIYSMFWKGVALYVAYHVPTRKPICAAILRTNTINSSPAKARIKQAKHLPFRWLRLRGLQQNIQTVDLLWEPVWSASNWKSFTHDN